MKYKILSVAILFGLIASLSPAYALPGQTTAQFKAWLKTRPILNGSKLEYDEGDYMYYKSIKGGKIEFYVTLSAKPGKVVQEGYDYTEAFSDKKLVSSVKELYGSSMYNELMNAKIVYNKKSTAFYNVTDMILKGSKYGFLITIAGPDKTGSEAHFTVNILKATEVQETIKKVINGEL